MAVFNAAANQVLAKPVTNYYAGKAKRQALKQGELQLQALEFEVENMEEKFDWQRNKEQRDKNADKRAEDEANRRQAEFEADVGEAAATQYAEDLYSRIHATETVAALEGPEAAMEHAYEMIAEYGGTLPERWQDGVKKVLEDKKITPEEIAYLKKRAAISLGITDATQNLETHKNYALVDENGKIIGSSIRSARPGSKTADDLVRKGYRVMGNVGYETGDDAASSKAKNVDWKRDIQSRITNEEWRERNEEVLHEVLDEVGIKLEPWYSTTDDITDSPSSMADWHQLNALYEAHYPSVHTKTRAYTVLNELFNVAVVDGERVLQPKEQITVTDEAGNVAVSLPNPETGQRSWYKVNRP